MSSICATLSSVGERGRAKLVKGSGWEWVEIKDWREEGERMEVSGSMARAKTVEARIPVRFSVYSAVAAALKEGEVRYRSRVGLLGVSS